MKNFLQFSVSAWSMLSFRSCVQVIPKRAQYGLACLTSIISMCLLVCSTTAAPYPYVQWTPAMSSSHSSDLGGYPAQNVFDSSFTSGGFRGDWSYEFGSAQGEAGFSLRDDFHGNWHSLNDVNLKQSPSGTLTREWIAADFGAPQKIFGADVWNTNWDVINLTRAAKNISIDVSTDNVNWTTVWSGDLAAAPGVRPHLMYDGVTYVNPSLGNGHPPQFGLLATDTLDFGGGVDARYVVVNFQSNQGGDPYFAIEEIKFVNVPEPASLTISIGVLLGIIGTCRRRKY